MVQYTARVSRDEQFWLIHVPELNEYTQARSVPEIEEMARDLVHVVTGEAKEDIALFLEYDSETNDR